MGRGVVVFIIVYGKRGISIYLFHIRCQFFPSQIWLMGYVGPVEIGDFWAFGCCYVEFRMLQSEISKGACAQYPAFNVHRSVPIRYQHLLPESIR